METAQGYYEAPQPRPEDVPSLYAELYRSRDYGDEGVRPGDAQLRELGTYWTAQLSSEYRSPRAKKEIHTLLGRISFELVMRGKEAYALRDITE